MPAADLATAAHHDTGARSTAACAGLFGGAFVVAIFLLLVWGAQRDAAHGETPAAPTPAAPSAQGRATATAPAATPARRAISSKRRPSTGSVSTAPAAPIKRQPGTTAAPSRSTGTRSPTVKVAPIKRRPTVPVLPGTATKPDRAQVITPAAQPEVTPAPASPERPAAADTPAVADTRLSDVASAQPPDPKPDPLAIPLVGAVPEPVPGTMPPAGAPPRWLDPSSTSAPTLPAALPLKASLLEASRTGTGRVTTAAVAAPAINQCNGTDNAGGQGVTCTVTVINNLNVATGAASSTVTVNECHGAANAPLTCTPTTTSFTSLVTSVTQCDGSGNGGGGAVRCSVEIINNITGTATTTEATINQCNGSGTGGGTPPTVVCTPSGATTGATITQCNGSGNGGGGTARVQCTVLPSTQTSALPVTVDQCNGSGNGDGGIVICTVRVTNNIIPPDVIPPDVIPPGDTPPGGTPPGGITAAGFGTPTAFRPPTAFDTSNAPAGTGGRAEAAATSLARTGSTTSPMILLGLLALVLGGLLTGLGRRRATPT